MVSAYGRDMEEDIITDTSGHFKKMLVVLIQVSVLEDIIIIPVNYRFILL